MTENEIIKALECCSKNSRELCALECPIFRTAGCIEELHKAVFALITRQKEELKRLKDIAESPILSKLIYVWENEAIKEFSEKAERIVELANRADGGYDIDELVKEMVGEE